MNNFRNHTPKRRIIKKVVGKHGDHRADLRLDYQNRCGYCNDIDTWRFNWYEIDHFVPQKYLVTVSSTAYENLVYACRSCNNAKRAEWPTKDEKVHHQHDMGFIDPCDDAYNDQFERLVNGRIVPQTPLGNWMFNTLRLYKPQHEIIWNIELLDTMIDEIEEILKHSPDTDLTDWLLQCYQEFRNYIKALSSAGL